MNPELWDRCKRIFSDAVELGAEERILLLDRECGEDSELRAEVLKMLAGYTDGASPLDVGAAERVLGGAQITELLIPGDIVGRYRVIRRIGQGGTSIVYLAEHVGLHTPRRFAIKVIAAAFVASQRERFDREVKILATLDHPNIARILDQGVTETGWPYLVMDYIDGVPIHKYCLDHKLAPPEIVRLMIECCRAVEYFHRNGVVHCDLKPANILVDAGGSPQILDFGIARLVEPDRVTRTGQTTRGIRPLTPHYASPEQLVGTQLTAATDIYSLGVVLYEALTGTLPFDYPDEPWPEISRKIAQQDPTPPSKVHLKSEDARFSRQLRGDLDAIVLKALAHDPARRYLSMEEMNADLKRYLAGESVKARRPSWVGQAGKILRRRQRVVVEVAVLISIALAIGFSTWRARHIETDRERGYVDGLRAILRPPGSADPEQLPESLGARTALIDEISHTIDRVAPQVSQHPDLVPDLAEAMIKTAELLGNPYSVNVGRLDDARVNYRRAFEILRDQRNARSADIRARAALGIGDTYSHPAFKRDPTQAAEWYQRALNEIVPRRNEFPHTAAKAHARIGGIFELLGDPEDARSHYEDARRLLPEEPGAQRPLEAALTLMERASVEPAERRGGTYRDALDALQKLLNTNPHDVRTWHAAIEANLVAGLNDLQVARFSEADIEFGYATGLSKQILFQDAGDVPARRELAVALRRGAMSLAQRGNQLESNDQRTQATFDLTLAMQARAVARPVERPRSCPEPAERPMEGASTAPLQPGHLLLGNGKASNAMAMLFEFSPESKEMNVLAPGGSLSDVEDIAPASRTEIYLIDRGLTESGGIVRLRHAPQGWLKKPLACGGLLRRPVSIAYGNHHLIVADSDEQSVRLIEVDPQTGEQTLIGQMDTFAEPGKIVYSAANNYYLSLFWSGEGGPAEIESFDATAHKFATAARYGLLEDPVALGLTPKGNLIAGDREWTGGGQGYILRIGPHPAGPASSTRAVDFKYAGAQIVSRRPELSRVTAVTAVSEREAWYSAAAVPASSSGASHAKLFKLDLVTGNATEVTISDKILAPTVTLVRVD